MHLLPAQGVTDDTSNSHRALSLVSSYEDGSVKLWKYHNVAKQRSIEGIGWGCVWSSKLHVESGACNAQLLNSRNTILRLQHHLESHGDRSFD